MLIINIFLCSAMTCSCTRTDIIEKEPSIIEDYDPYRSWHGSQYGSRFDPNTFRFCFDSPAVRWSVGVLDGEDLFTEGSLSGDWRGFLNGKNRVLEKLVLPRVQSRTEIYICMFCEFAMSWMHWNSTNLSFSTLLSISLLRLRIFKYVSTWNISSLKYYTLKYFLFGWKCHLKWWNISILYDTRFFSFS